MNYQKVKLKMVRRARPKPIYSARYPGEKTKFYFKSKSAATKRKLVGIKKVSKPTWVQKAKAW